MTRKQPTSLPKSSKARCRRVEKSANLEKQAKLVMCYQKYTILVLSFVFVIMNFNRIFGLSQNYSASSVSLIAGISFAFNLICADLLKIYFLLHLFILLHFMAGHILVKGAVHTRFLLL